MRISRKLLKVLLAVCAVVLCNQAMDFVLSPNYGSARITFTELQERDDIDLVIVGSSLAEMNIDPGILAEKLGISVYNAGTAGQSPESTAMLVEYLIRYKHPKEIVYAVNYSSLGNLQSLASQIAFNAAYKDAVPLLDDIRADLRFFSTRDHFRTAEALSCWAPWSVNHTFLRPTEIIKNVIEKIKGTAPSESLNIHSPTSRYYNSGFQAYDGMLDYNDVGKKTSIGYFNEDFYPPALQSLKDIARMCRENDVRLYVVNTPKPVFDVVSYGPWYFEKMQVLEDLFAEYEVPYVDFSLAVPELYEAKEEYYHDYDHLCYDGAEVFSASLAELIPYFRSGGYKDLFRTPEAYLASIKTISSVDFDLKEASQGYLIQAFAWTGSNVECEYRYLIRESGTEEWTVVKDFSDADVCGIQPGTGTWDIRVEARVKGESAVRYYTQTVRNYR